MSITKKRLFGILLSLAMAMGLMLAMSATAWASDPVTEYDLWVGGVQVTSENASDVLGAADGEGATVTFTPANGTYPATLTLSGANITTGHYDSTSWYYGGIIYEGSTPLTIKLASGTNNTVDVSESDKVRNCGIYCKDDSPVNLTITGEGSMTAKGKFTGINANDITINNGVVEAKAVEQSAIRVTNSMTINGGTVTASGNKVGIIGIYENNKVITISGGKVTATGSDTAIDGSIVKNAIAGTGWSNVEGTEDQNTIVVSKDGQDLSKYKKVQFPAVVASVTVGENTTNYTDFSKAVNEWTDGSTLTLLSDVTMNAPLNIGDNTETLDLNGYGITYTGADNKNVLDIGSSYSNQGGLTLKDSNPSTTHYITLDDNGRGKSVSDTGEVSATCVKVNGGYITGGKASGVKMNAGTFTMSGGTIVGNTYTAGSYGGGVYIFKGTFEMSGGTITGNNAEGGGGVYVQNGTFEMSGGMITGNNAMYDGGGVYVGGTFNLSGGKIAGNNAMCDGGGVYVGGTFNLSGGKITGNNAKGDGGGVYVGGTFNLSGKPMISGNVKGGTYDAESGCYGKANGSSDCNIYLSPKSLSGGCYTITIDDALTGSDGSIGVTMDTPGVFTSSSDGVTAKTYAKNFTSDDTGYSIKEEGNELKVARPDIYYIDPTAGTQEQTKTIDNYEVLPSSSNFWGNGKTYVVKRNTTIDNRINVSSSPVNLILLDGATLTAPKGITVNSGKTLNIYAGSISESIQGNGKLLINDVDNGTAGIGGSTSGASCGSVTINGGHVTVTGGANAAGIGGGYYSSTNTGGAGGTVTINGGTVTATGGTDAVAIGGGKGASDNGSLTLGKGVKLETSTDGLSWTESTDTSYRTRYMRTETHFHDFTYSASGATITATCVNTYGKCTLDDGTDQHNHTATLTIAAPDSLSYDGTAKAAKITDSYGIQGDAKIMYQKKTGEASYDTATTTAPTDAGTYKASITLGEGDVAKTASVEYTITAAPLTITGATLTSRDYVKDKKDVEVTAVTFSGGSPTINTDFTATAEMADDKAGDSKAVTVTVTLSNTNYSLAANTYQTTVKITKATPKAPDAPTAASKTDTSVTLTATNGYQYKCGNNGTWQDNPEFTGLEECKSYVFFQRVKEDSNHNNSDSSGGTTVNTAVKYTKYSRSGNIILIEIKQVDDYIPAENSNKTIWLKEGDFYVVKGDVMLSKGLVYSGNVRILLCDNSKLTIKGGIWHYGSELTIYGQNGEIIVTGDKTITPDEVPAGATISTDSALDGGTIDINGGKLSVTPGSGQDVFGANAKINLSPVVSLTGTKDGGEKVVLTEGEYGATDLNQFKSFEAESETNANQGGGSSGGGSAAETAQQVADKINALPNVSALTLKDADAVATARAEFNKLSEADKAKVSQETLKKLRDAEAKIAELKKADEDQKAAGVVSKQIEALPDVPAEASEADAQAAYGAYMALTDAQKALLSDDAKQKVAAYKYFYEVKYAEAQKVKMSSAKAKKGGKAVVKWKKNKAADGYRLYYKAKGVKAKYVNINSYKTVKTTVKKLKDGKVYSFKVRPYTKVNDPSTGKAKNVYGKWSKAKKVRAKK